MTRRHGEGTIEEVGNSFRFRCPDGAGGRYTSPAEYSSSEAAAAGMASYARQVNSGAIVMLGGLSLREYVEGTWLPRMEREKPRSYRTYKSVWTSQISHAPFAGRSPRSIRRREVKAWATSMTVEHPEHPVSVLRTILAAGIDDELLEVNPAAKLRLPRKKRESTSPTAAEAAALMGCDAIPWPVRAIVGVALGTGLRPGEWRHLRLADVRLELEPPRLIVQRGSDHAHTTKSGKTRAVPLLDSSPEVLRLWLHDLPGFAPQNPLGLVFPKSNGKRRPKTHPLGTFQRQDAWLGYLEAAGVRDCVRLHDLRHVAATMLLTGEHGDAWSPVELQHLLGHASVQTTEGTYLHPGEALVMRAAARKRAVQNSPPPAAGPSEITGRPPVSQQSPSLSGPPALGPAAPVYPGIAPAWTAAWTVPGLLAELRQAISQLHAGKLSQAEARRLGERLVAARREGDAVELAASRLAGEHWRAALAELVTLLVPDAVTARRKPSKGGA